MRRFDTYTPIEKDEIRKQGLRTLSYAFKFEKCCSKCGWDNPNHLWLSSVLEAINKEFGSLNKKWMPLDRVPACPRGHGACVRAPPG